MYIISHLSDGRGMDREHALYFSASHTAPHEHPLWAEHYATCWESREEQVILESSQAYSVDQHVNKHHHWLWNGRGEDMPQGFWEHEE